MIPKYLSHIVKPPSTLVPRSMYSTSPPTPTFSSMSSNTLLAEADEIEMQIHSRAHTHTCGDDK